MRGFFPAWCCHQLHRVQLQNLHPVPRHRPCRHVCARTAECKRGATLPSECLSISNAPAILANRIQRCEQLSRYSSLETCWVVSLPRSRLAGKTRAHIPATRSTTLHPETAPNV